MDANSLKNLKKRKGKPVSLKTRTKGFTKREMKGNYNRSRLQIKKSNNFWKKSLKEFIEPGITLEKEQLRYGKENTRKMAKSRLLSLLHPEKENPQKMKKDFEVYTDKGKEIRKKKSSEGRKAKMERLKLKKQSRIRKWEAVNSRKQKNRERMLAQESQLKQRQEQEIQQELVTLLKKRRLFARLSVISKDKKKAQDSKKKNRIGKGRGKTKKSKKTVSFSEQLEQVKSSSIDSKNEDQELLDIFGSSLTAATNQAFSNNQPAKIVENQNQNFLEGFLSPIEEEPLFKDENENSDKDGFGDLNLSGIGSIGGRNDEIGFENEMKGAKQSQQEGKVSEKIDDQ